MAKFRKEAGWLRRAQDAKRRSEEARRLAERGPVSALPVPADVAKRITADELGDAS